MSDLLVIIGTLLAIGGWLVLMHQIYKRWWGWVDRKLNDKHPPEV